MTTIERVSDKTGFSKAEITGKNYKGAIKNIRLATVWIMQDEFDKYELSVMFDRKVRSIEDMIACVRELLDVKDARMIRIIAQLHLSTDEVLKTALKQAVDSWDKTMTLNKWIFQKGIEFQSNKI